MEQINYKFRNITEKDYEFIYEVKKKAYKKYVEINYGYWDEKIQREYFKNFINTYKESAYVITYDGQDIGFIPNGETEFHYQMIKEKNQLRN